MQRVLVIGSSGAGKSMFARALGQYSGLPIIHLDQLFWNPGWVQVPRDTYHARLDAVLAGERWIIDGLNISTFDRRIPRADTIIWLKRSRAGCYWRIAHRVMTTYGQVRPDMAPGCPERLDWEFLRYVWQFPSRYQPRIVAALDRHDAWGRTTILRGDAAARDFLRQASQHRRPVA
jgi:adenylate kinase family enzyme